MTELIFCSGWARLTGGIGVEVDDGAVEEGVNGVVAELLDVS